MDLRDAFESLTFSTKAAQWSMEMLGASLDDLLDHLIGRLTPLQKSEYYRLIRSGLYPFDALALAGKHGRWVITKRAADAPRTEP